MSNFFFSKILTLFLLLNSINCKMQYFPDDYKKNDIIFPENDVVGVSQYNLVDAKVLTREKITLYIKKQGINLVIDDCCEGNDYIRFNAWDTITSVQSESDLQEILSYSIYNSASSIISYKFPVPRIETEYYTVYHKLWIFDKDNGNPPCIMFFTDKNGVPSGSLNININKFVTLEMTYSLADKIVKITSDSGGGTITLNVDFSISLINFKFTGKGYSPAIALHWTLYKIDISNPNEKLRPNFSLKGTGLCSYTNPCVKGYACTRGICVKCHASCFDCINGGLSTDCLSQCSPISSSKLPDRGSCPLGYVDLVQYEDFSIEDIVPPLRNRRLMTSFWFFLTSLPDDKKEARIDVSLDPDYVIYFFFEKPQLKIKFRDLPEFEVEVKENVGIWYYIKVGYSIGHGYSMYIKYFNGEKFEYFYRANDQPGNDNFGGQKRISYQEANDFAKISFAGFTRLINKQTEFRFYIKELILFREYVKDPYDNKYFSYEKIFTSTFELPEVMFIIPFDELIKNGDKYDIKCYSYDGSILEHLITLTPYYNSDESNLYPPKTFRPLNLLGRNEKYTSPDLIKIEEVKRDNNTLIASYDYIPLSCVDNYFITYNDDDPGFDLGSENTEYIGHCNLDCKEGYSMLYGLSENKGFCNKKCGSDNVPSSSKCLNNNYDLLHLREKVQCKEDYYAIFYNCDKRGDDEKYRNIRYAGDEGPANIVIDVTNYNLISYIIDFWMRVDGCGSGGTLLFYTNQFYINNQNQFFSFENRRTADLDVSNGGWNHYSIEVFYDPKEDYNKKSKIYLQKNFLPNPEPYYLVEYSENILPLEYIYFCNGRKSTCNNLNLYWYCANYKNLRLFNGNLAQRHILYRYDEYYEKEQFLLSSIKFYYPLFGHYIANNLWYQFNSEASALDTTSPTNNWNYPQYSYETIRGSTCTGCNNCKTDPSTPPYCFMCDASIGNYLFKKGNSIGCRNSNQIYVLRLPTTANFRMIPLKGLKQPAVTISFFIKIYGFAIGGKIDVIYLGPKLKISYNSDFDSDSFGLNLITYKGDNEIVVSNYYHFRKHFGLWTFISVSVYDQTNEQFFPPMVRFEINDKKMPIIGSLENLSVGDIYFSEHLFALVKSITVYRTYLIGNLGFELNNKNKINSDYSYYKLNEYLIKTNTLYESYFDGVSQENDCLFSRYGVMGTQKDNPDNIIDTYECVMDSFEEIFSKLTAVNKYLYFSSEETSVERNCVNNRVCFGQTKKDFSCNFINDNLQIFLGNVSNHYCENFKFINFAKADEIRIKNVPGPGQQYTLHFWVFAYSYIDKVFAGIKVDWVNFVYIEVGLDSSGKYYFTCAIKNKPQKKYVEFKMNEWNFLHCSVDYKYNYFYLDSDEKEYEYSFSYNEDDQPNYNTPTDLVITDLNTVDDWGILFYKHIRIWNRVLPHSTFLSRILIENNFFGNNDLLYQWQTGINSAHEIVSTKDTTKNYKVKYSNKTIGSNIVNEKIYLDNIDLPLQCDENGQYFDRKTEKCVNFTDLSDLTQDLTFDKIDLSYSHSYGMAFWIFLEDHTNVIESIDFIWEYHMRVSLQFDSTFKSYCFPQNYEPYSDVIKNDNKYPLNQKSANVLNSVMNENTDNLSGRWSWFQCFISYYNREFYLNENTQTLITETLYREGNTEFKNDEPLGRFFNDIDGNVLSNVELRLSKNKNSKIYMRCFYLFKDYLPYNYNFKYMDMTQIGTGQFPPLTFAVNFAHYNFRTSILKYKKYTSLDNIATTIEETLVYPLNKNTQLCSNFDFLPLCDPTTKEKYNSETKLCQEITLCDPTELNAVYCMEERTPLICKKNYYINIDSSDGTVTCENYCKDKENYFRTPGSNHATGICGTKCLSVDVLKTCPNSASAILTYESDFQCKEGLNRLGYQCFTQPSNNAPNKGALFYSGSNFPYNIAHTFGNDARKEFDSMYVLEFWFMIDNVIYTDFTPGNEYHYFFAYPHELFMKQTSDASGTKTTYYYGYLGSNAFRDEIPEGLIHQYEWNKILIFADKKKKEIKVYFNFDKEQGHYVKRSVSSITNLDYIQFCTNSRPSGDDGDDGLNYPSCKDNINWASAYYNNIRVWNLHISTIDTIQSFINGIYTEHPTSLILFYPLTIQYLDNNQMTNIMTNYEDREHISAKIDEIKDNKKSALYNKDNIIIYNYSTKFDWGILHKKQFVNSMNDLHQIDPNDANNKCNEHCIRCLKTDDITECYECETGYVLQYKECKDARKLYFLKTPSGTSGASIIFKNKPGKDFLSLTSFTIVFWMKFFGIKYSTASENSRIMSIDTNTYLAYRKSTYDIVMMENSKTMFDDENFRDYFGIWIPISIANYISNSINYVYPNMFTLSVNKHDIPFTSEYVLAGGIPESGIKITELSFGSEIIALFAELSIYSKFIQGGYGRIRSLQNLKDQFYYLSLTGTKPNDCLVVQDDLSSDISLICAPDYSVNFIDNYFCKDDKKYFDPYDNDNNEKDDDNKCGVCDGVCTTLCFGSDKEECTCDMTDGIYWLRRNTTGQTYCEQIYYLDFSNIKTYTFYGAPVTKTKEYTIEFWVFVYSYAAQDNFKELYLEWNYHNKITLFYDDNSLKVNCQPIWRSHDFSSSIYSDVRTNTIQYHTWEYVRCGTDLKNAKYFSNTNIEYTLKAKKDTFFDFDSIDSDTPSSLKFFKIYKSQDFLYNFGFVFIKEIKLWQQYNIDFLDTKHIYFDMNKITKEELKENFPGLLLYYQNNYFRTELGTYMIVEQLSGKNANLTKEETYLGYNIIDDDYPQYFEKVYSCPYGQVYDNNPSDGKTYCTCASNTIPTGDSCVAKSDVLCQVYSNLENQCLQCKDNNQFLNRWTLEFPQECYNQCPATLYADPLINQCRRCHETCYECTGEFYNNCVSCTGVLYFNFKENTCIPNCQTAGLTRSLTKKNICVVFDAGAELVNVEEDTPVDVNNFDYIEAKVVLPTSPEYQTYWYFDTEKTNLINEELGFTDDIKNPDEHPFTGDRTKLNVTLDKTFFKTEHKYVFELKIYAENKGLEVPVYVYWTLTMNSPPYGGRVTTMPSVGLFNTTTFIIRCVDFLDENTKTEDLLYDFYYIEENTNMKIKLSEDFSTNNEVYSNFTVRFYQLEYSNINIYCEVKDKWDAVTQSVATIMIVNDKHSDLYNLKQIVSSFYLVEDELTDIQLLARSEVLMSLGLNPYNDRAPTSYYTTYENSLTGDKVIKVEPQCVNGYCNDNGDCEVIDIALTCKCNPTHLGKQCFLDKNGYSDLSEWYLKMYKRIMNKLDNPDSLVTPNLNDELFYAVYKLFFAAQNFFQNGTFFNENLNEFRNYLKREFAFDYITQDVDKFNKLFDLDVFYLNYFYSFETQTKLTKKINEGYLFRNKTLTKDEVLTYKTSFEKFYLMLDEDTIFMIKNYHENYIYSCQYFNYYLIKIDQNFNDEDFFDSLKTVYISYKTSISFMKCLKEKYPLPFNFYLNYIEYLVNPMSFDNNFYPNVTSPYFTLKIFDSGGNEININECPSNSLIQIQMPFNAYDWINYINEQRWLFDPRNYKLEDDPVFRDPILIRDDGSVSDDTVEERIKMYYRYYNIVGLVYTPNRLNLYEYSSIIFKNISNVFFLLFETNHLSGFSSMLIPNPMKFIVDGRFFYIPRYMVLLFIDNHLYNPVFYIDAFLFLIFVVICLIYNCKDFPYYDNLETLDFLIKEVYKNNFGYNQIDPGINDANIYKIINHVNRDLKLNDNKNIRTMFDQYEFDDIKEDEDENKSDKSNELNKDNINININAKTGRKLMNLDKEYNSKKKKDINNDVDSEQKTELKSTKKKKRKRRSTKMTTIKSENKKSNNSNPPKKDKYSKAKRNSAESLNDKNDIDNNNNYLETMDIEVEINKKKRKSKLSVTSQDRISKQSKPNSKKNQNLTNNGYDRENDVEDFDENKLEQILSSEKSSYKPRMVGFSQVSQNYDLGTMNSKGGLNSSKYSKFSKFSKQSKKSYFIDKDNTRPDKYISIEKFHNKSYRLKLDKNIMDYNKEKKRALDEYTRLNVTAYEFFKYNLTTRHILISPFYNLTLYHNRWKKLILLLTQFFTYQLFLSVFLTNDENILLPNIPKMFIACLISMLLSNISLHLIIPFYSMSFYDKKRMFRYAEHGESLYVYKVWGNLTKKMKVKNVFSFIIVAIFWIINFYVTLGFTAVWKVQRTTFIVCFFMTIALDLIVGEILIEAICAFLFIKRKKYNLVRNIGELFNRYRNYRTLYP